MTVTELICIVCPKGCHLKVAVNDDSTIDVTGQGCPRGIEYGKKELVNPTRVLTSTVKIVGAELSRLPVKTSADIPKSQIKQAMQLLNDVTAFAPIKIGDIVLENILGLNVNFVATKTINAYQK